MRESAFSWRYAPRRSIAAGVAGDAAGRGAVHPEGASNIGAGAAGCEHGENLGPFIGSTYRLDSRREMAMRFQNKVALVTGGASGIGKEVATRFVTEGGAVVINGRDRAKAEAVAREIDPTGKRVVVHAGDIALPATGEAVVRTAIDRFGRLDVLFNNAGIFTPKPFLEVEEAEYDRFLGIILKGKFFAAQAAAKAMKNSGRGGAILQTGGPCRRSARLPRLPIRPRKRGCMR
jgi:hypothetical protein